MTVFQAMICESSMVIMLTDGDHVNGSHGFGSHGAF